MLGNVVAATPTNPAAVVNWQFRNMNEISWPKKPFEKKSKCTTIKADMLL